MRPPPLVAGLGLAGALLLGLAAPSCLFSPRPAPPPCDPNTDPTCRSAPIPQPRITPEAVRNNIQATLQALVVEPIYDDNLDAGFRYVPDQAAQSLVPPGFFDNWGKQKEVSFMRSLLEGRPDATHPRRMTVSFSLWTDTGVLQDPQRRYSFLYAVALEYPDSTQASQVRCESYRAEALWDFVADANNLWTLQKWEDKQPENSPTDPCAQQRGSLGILRGERGSATAPRKPGGSSSP